MDEVKTTTEVEQATPAKEPALDFAALMEEVKKLKDENAKFKDENSKLKQANTNASADAADWKKKFRSTQDEATRAEAEKAELIERYKKENEELKRNQILAEQNAEWLAVGMDAAMAKEAAEATVGNDFAALMAVMKRFMVEHDKSLNAKAIRETPAPVGGASTQSVTAEQFAKMGYHERTKLFDENPELYRELTK